MTERKKPADDPAATVPAENQIKPGDMTYPTPELDPNTGAPRDTRFQRASQEAPASKQAPKSEARQAQEGKAKNDESEDQDEDEDRPDDNAKGAEKPRRRR